MDPYFDRRFVMKSKKSPTFSIRNLGLLMTLVVVVFGILAIKSARSQGGVERQVILPISQTPPVVLPTWQQGPFPVLTPGTASPFSRPAPVGIDERFIVAAPLGIDDRMIIPRNQMSQYWRYFVPSNSAAPLVPAR